MYKTQDDIQPEDEEGEVTKGPVKLRVDCHFGKRKRLAAIRTCTSHVQVSSGMMHLTQVPEASTAYTSCETCCLGLKRLYPRNVFRSLWNGLAMPQEQLCQVSANVRRYMK